MIPLTIPDISEADIERVVGVLRSGMLVQGQEVEALERCAASLLGVGDVVAVSSGTAALHLALRSLGVGPGDEVIVPAFSFIATANAVELVGATPAFVDIDPATFNINVRQVPGAITPKTKAIIPVHEFGMPCDIDAVTELAAAHGLRVVEDAACAIGAKHGGRPVGSFGDLAAFSLHPRKTVTAGEGGLLACPDAGLARRLRSLRNHGIRTAGAEVHFDMAGFNYRLTDVAAALAAGQMERLPALLERRREIARNYLQGLAGCDDLRLPAGAAGHSWQTFHVVLPESVDRAKMIADLRGAEIGSNRGAQCIPAEAYYQEKYRLDCERRFPAAASCAKHGLALPLYPKMGEADVAHVVSGVRDALANQQ